MAKFTDIYKQELKSRGVISSIGSSVLKQTKERLDPRNILFGGKGFIGATGRKIFGEGFKAVPQRKMKEDGEDLKAQAFGALLESSKRTENRLEIIGKNTMPLRGISRDINVVRQNIIKLVKLQGGISTNKADAFFRSQREEEAAYENSLKKMSAKQPEIKKVSNETKETGSGPFAALKTFGNVLLSTLAATLGKIPGLIIDGIKGIFKNLPVLLSAGVAGTKFTAKALWSALKFAGSRLLLPLITTPAGLAILGTAGIAWLIKNLLDDDEEDPLKQFGTEVERDENTGAPTDGGKLQMRLNQLVGKVKAGKVLSPSQTYGLGSIDTKDSKQLENFLQKLEDLGGEERMLAARYRSETSGIPLEDVLKSIEEQSKSRAEERSLSQMGAMSLGEGSYASLRIPGTVMERPGPLGPRSITPTRVPSDYIDPGKAQILNEIGLKESRGDYNALVYGKNTPSRASLTNMTLQEVMNYQDGMVSRGHASTAVGKYQITKDTLDEFAKKTGVSLSEKFTPEIQDKIAAKILDEAGYSRFARGEISRDQFTNNVARRWASMPTTEGKSFYDGIAGNKSLISLQSVQQLYSSSAALTAATNSLKDMQNAAQIDSGGTTTVITTPSASTPAPMQAPDKVSALNVDALQLFAGVYA